MHESSTIPNYVLDLRQQMTQAESRVVRFGTLFLRRRPTLSDIDTNIRNADSLLNPETNRVFISLH